MEQKERDEIVALLEGYIDKQLSVLGDKGRIGVHEFERMFMQTPNGELPLSQHMFRTFLRETAAGYGAANIEVCDVRPEVDQRSDTLYFVKSSEGRYELYVYKDGAWKLLDLVAPQRGVSVWFKKTSEDVSAWVGNLDKGYAELMGLWEEGHDIRVFDRDTGVQMAMCVGVDKHMDNALKFSGVSAGYALEGSVFEYNSKRIVFWRTNLNIEVPLYVSALNEVLGADGVWRGRSSVHSAKISQTVSADKIHALLFGQKVMALGMGKIYQNDAAGWPVVGFAGVGMDGKAHTFEVDGTDLRHRVFAYASDVHKHVVGDVKGLKALLRGKLDRCYFADENVYALVTDLDYTGRLLLEDYGVYDHGYGLLGLRDGEILSFKGRSMDGEMVYENALRRLRVSSVHTYVYDYKRSALSGAGDKVGAVMQVRLTAVGANKYGVDRSFSEVCDWVKGGGVAKFVVGDADVFCGLVGGSSIESVPMPVSDGMVRLVWSAADAGFVYKVRVEGAGGRVLVEEAPEGDAVLLRRGVYHRVTGACGDVLRVQLEGYSADDVAGYVLEFVSGDVAPLLLLPKGVSLVGDVVPTADHRYLLRIWAGLACLQDMGYNEHRLRLTAETAGKVWVGTKHGGTNLVEAGQTGNEMQMPDLQYSVDGGAWQQWPGAGEAHGVALEAGQVMRLKGTNVDSATGLGVFNRNGRSGVSFKASAGALMRVAGDVTCLLNGGVGGDVKLGNGCFIDLFGYSSINCDALVLPSLDSQTATYTYNGCYHDMFCNNTRTTRVHVQLSQVRYGTLIQMCYNAKSLNYIEVDGKNVAKNNGTAFVNVASEGRFVVPAGYRASWEALIPAGWTVVEK